ncbi:MAG: 1-aminocyclopropane-1-carboxylate deaminase [Rhodobacterales bacterium]|nr:MAG: 1-aminocyclopropane-1-carboxylate deaminase [Rhodobacterales bacterium]
MKHSTRGNVDPFIVMDVMEAARAAEAEGRHIIHMEVGQPARGAPAAARAALARAMEDGPLGYTVALGLPELRARIAQHYRDWYGVTVDPARIIVTPGASGAFLLAFAALFDAGQRVGLGMPCYPSYRQILRAQSLTPVGLETRAEDGFQPRPDSLTGQALDGLLVASPGNPTGSILGRAQMETLAGACADQGISLISDEIYHGLSYGDRAVSALEVTDDCYVINSFSKYFAMTGWRVGWMVVPEDHVRQVERLAQNMFICPPHASQVLALHTMDCAEDLDATLADYARSRDLMLERLPKMGLTRFAPPDGAFYVYADVSHLTDDSLSLAREILDEAGVAVTPGLDFDPSGGHRWMRFSYARAPEDIAEGLDRLQRFLEARA